MLMRLASLLLLGAIGLAGCGGGNTSGISISSPTPPKLLTNIAVPHASSPRLSFDIGYEAGKYYLSDRINKAVDVVDTKSNTLIAQIARSIHRRWRKFR